MTLNCVDLSNYSEPLSSAQAQGLKDAGVVLAIVQAVDPPPGYPAGVTRQQIQACVDAGIVVDAYVWLWFALGVDDITSKLALLEGLPIRRVWLDVEDQAAAKYDLAVCHAKVDLALEECDDWLPVGHDLTGIYSGRWFWGDQRYMGNTATFKDRDLWDSNYDGDSDPTANFRPYGGWDHCAIKQFRGTSTLAGVPNVDLNALSAEELAKLTTTDPSPDVDAAWQAKKDLIVGLAGELLAVADQITAEANRKGGPRVKATRTLAGDVRARAQTILA